jgi:hypothetical protein
MSNLRPQVSLNAFLLRIWYPCLHLAPASFITACELETTQVALSAPDVGFVLLLLYA